MAQPNRVWQAVVQFFVQHNMEAFKRELNAEWFFRLHSRGVDKEMSSQWSHTKPTGPLISLTSMSREGYYQ